MHPTQEGDRWLAAPPIAISSMGLTFSSLYNWFVGGGEYKVVMVGLDNAGKTSILYRL